MYKYRTSIALPGQQSNCIEQVAAAAKGPVILVILSGGCVDISAFRDSDNIDAIIWADTLEWYAISMIFDFDFDFDFVILVDI